MTDLLVRLINLPLAVQRSIAACLCMTVIVLSLFTGYLVVSGLHGQCEAISEGRATLARLDHLIEQDKARPAEIPVSSGDVSEFLVGENDAVIQAALQTKLNAIASSTGTSVLSTGAIAPVEKDGVSYVGLRASVEGSTAAIYNTVLQLETARPYLVVNEITIRGSATTFANDAPLSLSAQLSFSGARAPSGDSP